jgi:hypothetical protein
VAALRAQCECKTHTHETATHLAPGTRDELFNWLDAIETDASDDHKAALAHINAPGKSPQWAIRGTRT